MTSCVPQEDEIKATSLMRRWDASSLPLTVKIQGEFYSMTGGSESLTDPAADDGNYTEYDLFEEMQKAWNDADPDRNYFVLGHGQQTTYTPGQDLANYRDAEIGIYVLDSWIPTIGFGVLAITSYFGEQRSSYIRMIHGDIMVNHEDYSFTNTVTNTNYAYYDLPSVILHELGHLIGLQHTTSSTVGSIMYPSLAGGEKKRTLSTYDAASVRNLYNSSTLALTASRSLASFSMDEDSSDSAEPKYVSGYIELREDGTCRHFENGKLIQTHKHNIKKIMK